MADPLDTPLDTPLYLIRDTYLRGVEPPGTRKPKHVCAKLRCDGERHTYDWRRPPGSPENTHRIAPALEQTTLRAGLATAFDEDVLFLSYALMRDGALLTRQPRICKGALPWLRAEGFEVVTTAFLADVDNPGHAEKKGHWNDELRSRFFDLRERAPSLGTAAIYFSPQGYRVIQPLAAPVPVDQAEPMLRAWLAQLRDEGCDPSVMEAKDWTRLQRVPFCVRDGKRITSEWMDTSRCVAITPPPAPTVRARPRRQRITGVPSEVPEFSKALPADWTPMRVRLVADAVRRVESEWHRLFLALAGALLERGVDAAFIPAICEAVSLATGTDDRTEDRVLGAMSTVAKAASGQKVTGDDGLRAGWPTVADALDETTPTGALARVAREIGSPTTALVSAEEAYALITRALAGNDAAFYGPGAIASDPGTGKTNAVIERARRLPLITDRAAPGARMALAGVTNNLTMQIRAEMPDRVARVFGPLSHIGPGGEYTCIHRECAQALVNGGQSLEWEFCKGRGKSPCALAETCTAREGFEGPRNANLVVGPHELVHALDGYAGKAGLLVIDEPPALVRTEVLSVLDMDSATRFLDAFVERYVAAIAPALLALAAWVRELAPADATVPLPEAIARAINAVPTEVLEASGIHFERPADELAEEVLASARAAILGSAKSKAPPIQALHMGIARRSPGRAAELGRASRVLDLLWRGLTAAQPHTLRVTADRAAALTGIDPRYAAALGREGPVVILDAGAALHLPAVEKLLGHRPWLLDLRVEDGGAVERTQIVTSKATSSSWMPRRHPDWKGGGFLRALGAAIAWANESPVATLVIVTWRTLELAILHTLDPSDEAVVDEWQGKKLPAALLAEGRAAIAPILADFCGEILTGHFWSLRGLNRFARADALVTLGDPRENLGAVEDQAAFLGLDADGRLDELAGAELAQDHGRMRLVHREGPARLLHVGAVVDPTWRGRPVQLRELPVGRPPGRAAMPGEDLRRLREAAGASLRYAAAVAGVSKSALERMESGAVPVSAAVVARLQGLVRGVPLTPIQNED